MPMGGKGEDDVPICVGPTTCPYSPHTHLGSFIDPILHMSSDTGHDDDAYHPTPAVELTTHGRPAGRAGLD